MLLSGNELKRLGKLFRNGTASDEDRERLEDYRDDFDGALISAAIDVQQVLQRLNLPAVLGGRLKRTKSVIRKLVRPENHGMDLSRMDDIAGVRIIVQDIVNQDKLTEVLSGYKKCLKCKDLRAPDREYRAVHLTWKEAHGRVEVQLRTLVQQLWANESESFGEAVKEGGGPTEIREYLKVMAKGCLLLESGKALAPDFEASEVFGSRAPFTASYPRLCHKFSKATAETIEDGQTYLVVYDNDTNMLTQDFIYSPHQRAEAVKAYRNLSKRLDPARFEVILLNSFQPDALAVTHPRFYPEG